jgi:hypothetical protein
MVNKNKDQWSGVSGQGLRGCPRTKYSRRGLIYQTLDWNGDSNKVLMNQALTLKRGAFE